MGGMSQKAFMHRVDSAVTHKVAQELLATIRPLKRILREQQGKIEKLQKQKRKEKAVEETLARSLANKLKSGLLSKLMHNTKLRPQRHRKAGLAEGSRKAFYSSQTRAPGTLSSQPPSGVCRGAHRL